MRQKSSDERTRLFEGIARINDLDIACDTFLSESDLDFIAKYMTGLDNIKIRSVLPNNSQQTHLYYTMLSVVRSIKSSRTVTEIPVNVFWNCLPRFMHEVFQRPTTEKTLILYMDKRLSPEIDLEIDTDLCMKIWLSDSHLRNRSTLSDSILEMDRFSLMVSSYYRKRSQPAYDAFFRTKSTFKEVTLDIPQKFRGEQEPLDVSIAHNHTFVETLTILSEPQATVQLLLDKCYVAFPKLKSLTLDGFWGNQLEDTNKYQLELPKFTLEKLVINVTRTHHIEGKKFILLEMEVLSLDSKHLYKVPLSSSKPVRIDDQDLSSAVPEEDYILIHLVVGSLQHLQLNTKRAGNYGMSTKLKTKLEIQTAAVSTTYQIVNKARTFKSQL